MSASTAYAIWVPIRIFRLSNRSAIRPPKAPINRIGRNVSAVFTPSANPLFVMVSTSQAEAVALIQVPVTDTTCPMK